MLLLTGVTAVKAQTEQPDLDEMYAKELVQTGTEAPDFKMNTPDGQTVQLKEFAKGKTVVLDFWASWCPDCRKDVVSMNARQFCGVFFFFRHGLKRGVWGYFWLVDISQRP